MLSPRVAGLPPSIIRDMFARRRPTSIDLTIGEPALAPEGELLDAAWRALRSGPQGYTPNAGLPELRAAIAAHHALPERSQAHNVIVTVGSEQAVFLGMISTLDAGDEVLIPEPGYPAYRGIAQLIGARAVTYPIARDTGLVARAAAIARAWTPRTKLLVMNAPSNPFGTLDEAEELTRIADLAAQRNFTILSDEIYGELYYDDAPPPSIARVSSPALLASGLSKSCALTGQRLGYLVAPAALVEKATLAHQLIVTCAPRLAQLVALEVFAKPEYLRKHVPFYRAAREAAGTAAAAVPADAPVLLGGGAFYAIVDVSAYAAGDPLALAIALVEEEDVVVVPGVAFGSSGDWFFRLSYASGPDAIAEGLKRIGRFLERRRAT